MSTIINIINKPYPFLYSLKKNLIVAFSVGVFIAVVNLIFAEDQYLGLSKTSLMLISGFSTIFTILLVFEVFLKNYISENTKENWKIKNEILSISFLLFVIFTFSYFILFIIAEDFSNFLTISFILKTLISVIVVGLVPTFFIVWINYTLILRQNLKITQEYNTELEKRVLSREKPVEENIIILPSKTQNETIEFNLEQLLFIRSDSNYIEVFTDNKGEISSKLYRTSLLNIEHSLDKYPNIIRVHRSFLVNIQNIKSTSGNARNYQLFFNNTDMTVPVARNRFKTFNEAFKT